MNSHDLEPDADLTTDQLKLIEKLTEDQIHAIDKALLVNCCDRWRKVAMVVGTAMLERPDCVEGIPDIYYSQRIRRLVETRLLESQGDLSYMRYSEVRRPVDNET